MIIRRATSTDATGMSELLNEIISIGGTTAFLDPVSPETIESWIATDPDNSTWLVAVDKNGQIIGYQSADRFETPDQNALSIATFARIGSVQSGIGSALFEATKTAVRELGYTWICASIRTDNIGGLRFYDSRGFKTYKTDLSIALSDGTKIGKVFKRYDL